MATLSVRKLEDEIYEELRVRAARRGVSMEEEVRQILRRAVAAPDRLGSHAVEYFGTKHGIDIRLERPEPHEPIDLTSR